MTSSLPEDSLSLPCPHNHETSTFYFSTYMDSNAAYSQMINDRIKENKENFAARAYRESCKYNIDFNEFLRGVPENEYLNYFEGFNEIRRLDRILYEKLVKEKEVKMQGALLQKQILEELEKIKKTGRIEMRDEKANTEKFFALNYSPKHRSSKKQKDDITDSIFAYSPFFKTELSKPDVNTEGDSSRSISTIMNEYTEKKLQDFIFDDEDHFLEDFRDNSESVTDKIVRREITSADTVKVTTPVKVVIDEISIEGLTHETTNKTPFNQEVSDMISDPVTPFDFKLLQITGSNLTPIDVNPDQIAGSSQSISCDLLNKLPSDVVLNQLVLGNISQNVNNESPYQSSCGQVVTSQSPCGHSSRQNINIESPNKDLREVALDQAVFSNKDSRQNINIESPNKVPREVALDQVVLINKDSSRGISIESPHQAPSDVALDQVVLINKDTSRSINIESPHHVPSDAVLDQVELSDTFSNQNISSESPAQAPGGEGSDQAGFISGGFSQYINNKSLSQSTSELEGLSGTELNQALMTEVVPSEIHLSLSNESLHQFEPGEVPSNLVQIKEMASSQDEHIEIKKKNKKNFIKRNIQLAKDADSVVSMTPEEKDRIENLLQDLDTLYETPKELKISDLATKDSLSQREDGFLSSREDKTSLAEIDSKLRYLMTPSEFEMVALKHRSPTPTQCILSTGPSPCDSFGLKQFGEKILLDTKEERNLKERLKKIDEQLNEINTRNADLSEVNSPLEPDVLQDLLESCAVSLTESAANSLCTTARSTNSSLDEDSILICNLSQQSPSDILSSVMKSPPCLADDVLQKLLAEASPMKYKPLSPISDRSNTPDYSTFRRSCSTLSSCTLSSFNSPRKVINPNISENSSPSKAQEYSLPELSRCTSLVGQDISSSESTSTQ